MKQAGPLPVGVWLLAVGGGLVASKFLFSDDGPKTAAPSTSILPDGGYGGPIALAPGGNGIGNSSEPAPDKYKFSTNEEWAVAVKKGMFGFGEFAPDLIDRAISKYVIGEPLTWEENLVLQAAFKIFGPIPNIVPVTPAPKPPPDLNVKPTPTPAPPPPPAPAPAPAPAPPQFTEYIVSIRGESLSSIANHYFGSYGAWPRIQQANLDRYPTLGPKPQLIYLGWKLRIPIAGRVRN